jgi:tRNA-dihydrouridine synthase 2
MSLKYGCSQVYSPELVDKLLISTYRVENARLNTVDFVTTEYSKLALRISPVESSRLVVQLGTACPELALQAAKIVEKDCSQIDVNCGCPKRFSLQGGMGAALLLESDKLVAILTNLSKNLSIPVSCKIRLLTDKDGNVDLERTIELMLKLAKTGICAIAVHCRMVDDRPRFPAHWNVIGEILARVTTLPVYINGDVYTLADIKKLEEMGMHFKILCQGVKGFMLARGAQFNPTVFASMSGDRSGLSMLSGMDAAREYLKTALDCDMPMHNIKWSLLQMVANIVPRPPKIKVVKHVMPKKRKVWVCEV